MTKSQQYQNLIKLVESLERMERRHPFDRLKKVFAMFLFLFFIVVLTLAAADFQGVKHPIYSNIPAASSSPLPTAGNQPYLNSNFEIPKLSNEIIAAIITALGGILAAYITKTRD